jgi:O-succinylbenzoic acid--CoA ligase
MNVLEEIRKSIAGISYDHPAIVTSSETISYKELQKKVRQTALYLRSLGIRQNTKAAILSSNNPDYVIYILALWELNSCLIPLNTKLIDSELTEIINFSDAEFLFYSENQKRSLSIDIPVNSFGSAPEELTDYITPGIDPDAISLIMFTSGVSGNPKGVMHSLNDLLNSSDNSRSFLLQTENDKWLASLPFYHIGGISIIIRALRFGSTLVIPDSLSIDDLRRSFDSFSPSLASLVSTQLIRLLETGWKPGKELRNILLGGGFTDEELIRNALSAGCNVSNVYGSTETSAFVTANNPAGMRKKPLSAGKALGKSKISVVDSEHKILEPGVSGEILIESNSLFHGYFKDKESLVANQDTGKYLTGDIGYIDEEGDLFVQARRTDLIISGGENINPLEVENLVNKVPGVEESCVFALPDKEWGQIVAAAVVLNKNISPRQIAEFMKGRIAGYKIPKRFFAVEKIPKTSLGKIIREKIREEIGILLT